MRAVGHTRCKLLHFTHRPPVRPRRGQRVGDATQCVGERQQRKPASCPTSYRIPFYIFIQLLVGLHDLLLALLLISFGRISQDPWGEPDIRRVVAQHEAMRSELQEIGCWGALPVRNLHETKGTDLPNGTMPTASTNVIPNQLGR